jgi:hypothetical protein
MVLEYRQKWTALSAQVKGQDEASINRLRLLIHEWMGVVAKEHESLIDEKTLKIEVRR